MERRKKSFAQLVLAYADGDLLEAFSSSDDNAAGSSSATMTTTTTKAGDSNVPTLAPSSSDTLRKNGNGSSSAAAAVAAASAMTTTALAGLDRMEDLDLIGGVEKEEGNLSMELQFVKPYLEFAGMDATINSNLMVTCTDEHLMKAACLAHSLLKLSSLLDSRLKVRSHVLSSSLSGNPTISAKKTLSNTRALREAIKTIKSNGLKMAKFCRADVLLQAVTRLSKVCNSSTIEARDAVRIPSSVNDFGRIHDGSIR